MSELSYVQPLTPGWQYMIVYLQNATPLQRNLVTGLYQLLECPISVQVKT